MPKNGMVELDEDLLIKIKNGFDEIGGLLKRIKDDAEPPTAHGHAPAGNPPADG